MTTLFADRENRNRQSVFTVGRALPGMMDVGRTASSGIKVSAKCVELLEEAQGENGCIQVSVDKAGLIGKKLFRIQVAEKPWGEKLDLLSSKVDGVTPCFFVLFRDGLDVLLIKYVPDNAAAKHKMLYASSSSELKQTIADIDSDIGIEEYNVSTADELSASEYRRTESIAAPLTDAEIARKEHDEAETGGGYSFLARITGIALPGMARGGSKYDIQNEESEEVEEDEEEVETINEVENKDKNRKSSRTSVARDLHRESVSKQKRVSHSVSKLGKSDKDEIRRSSVVSRASERSASPARNSDSESPKKPKKYSLSVLQEMVAKGSFTDGMDRSKMEIYLERKEYKDAFGIRRHVFRDAAGWKQKELRKKAGLF